MQELYSKQNLVTEITFNTSKKYKDPFNEIEFDVFFTNPDGSKLKIPGFWAGGNQWKIRYSSPIKGKHSYSTKCSDSDNGGLDNNNGVINISEYTGNNQLLKHGPLKVNNDANCFEHIDGKPFFWLGDTWWYGLVKDFKWPDEFEELTQDRIKKGFNLIQIVVGYLPAMPEGDPRGGNEGGLPWSEDYQTINTSYFDMADKRINHLVKNGLVPCIFGSWGYWLLRLGVKNMKKHWRYLIARYGAYPIIWCLCGEISLHYPDFLLKKDKKQVKKEQGLLREGWSDIAYYLKKIDPYNHPLTAHPRPGNDSLVELDKGAPIDFLMIQEGHTFNSLPNLIKALNRANKNKKKLPFLVGETVYEGIMGSSWQDIQRFVIWSCCLNGAIGHTYGAEGGGWQILHGKPFDYTSRAWAQFEDWREVAELPGSNQMQYCKKLFENYTWWQFKPHPEWLDIKKDSSSPSNNKSLIPHVAGIPKKIRIIYLPSKSYATHNLSAVVGLENDVSYEGYLFNPRNGEKTIIEKIDTVNGRWESPIFKSRLDWVIVLEAIN